MLNAEYQELEAGIEACFQDPDIRERSFYPEFRRAWTAAFERACAAQENYFDLLSPGCRVVHNECAGISVDFHIDRLKINEWYNKELVNKKKVVFSGKKLKKNHKTGELMFHDIVCGYYPEADEDVLTEDMRNIIACAFPGPDPRLEIVYGNKWVAKRFNPFRRSSVDVFLIGTDYVPAFLGNALETAVYLFLMDYCIIKMNHGKVKDDDIKGLLHIIRVSPMLRIKGLA